ncbi:SWI/SNF chromatin-remodeling complex subunit [Tulasnella sp. UAMH 9824]|nr:SWI/SNF chromatin-remodeling complex subunit [Tulasnella sp. UAMH 9824]
MDRRAGLRGEKLLCEPCGELYHRYRQSKEVADNEDPEYHVRVQRAEVNERKRKLPVKAEIESVLEDGTDVTADAISHAHMGDDGRPSLSQAQNRTASPPRPAKRIKTPESPPSPPSATTRIAEKEVEIEKLAPPQESVTTSSTPNIVAQPFPRPNVIPNVPDFDPETPQWLRRAVQELRAKYENDLFEAVIRPLQPEPASSTTWRIMCYDCFGKMYTPGPDETLLNFEVHLKNRQHRENVNARISAAALIAERSSRWGWISKRAVNIKADEPS